LVVAPGWGCRRQITRRTVVGWFVYSIDPSPETPQAGWTLEVGEQDAGRGGWDAPVEFARVQGAREHSLNTWTSTYRNKSATCDDAAARKRSGIIALIGVVFDAYSSIFAASGMDAG
jgi:hypothetical protein